MDTKVKVIIIIFVLIAILYLVNFVISSMNSMKKKETFIEMQVEDIATEDETKHSTIGGYDSRLTILDTVEKFVDDKEERIEIINDLFKDIESYKAMSTNEVKKTVENFIQSRKKEKFIESTVTQETAPAPAPEAQQTSKNSVKNNQSISPKISQLTTDIDSLYTQLSTIRTNVHSINKLTEQFIDQYSIVDNESTQPVQSIISQNKPKTKPQITETFIEGFENVRNFASYSLL